MWHFRLNHDEAWVCQFLKQPAQAEGKLALKTVLMNTNKSKRLPDKTVNMAAKALSLSPSMTFPKWQTSIDMRIPPVARSRMYRHSATMHSHKTPGRERRQLMSYLRE